MYGLAKAYRSIEKLIANRPVEDWEASNGRTKDTIRLDCSTVHGTTLWAIIYMRSHLGCGTDSVSIRFFLVSQKFQRRKSDANKQDFENKFNFTCQAKSTKKKQ